MVIELIDAMLAEYRAQKGKETVNAA